MYEDLLENLTSKKDGEACALAERIVTESRESDRWYPCMDAVASLLSHPKSLVRNRALHILAANVRWDREGRFDRILPEYLTHITDEKPITARQCIQALAEVGLSSPRYIPGILQALEQADLSGYKDSMRPLIEKDIAFTLQKLKATY